MADLEESYSNTSYLVDAPGAPIALRVGEVSRELDALLERFDESRWAFITAYNPYSEKREPEENQTRHARLVETVRERGLHAFPSRGVDDDGTWPTERGLLVLGIERDDAVALGRHFEQNAILAGTRGAPAELVFCVPT